MSQKIATPYKKGEIFETIYGQLRIMAIADNYAMVRYKGSIPFCKHLVKLRYFMFNINAKKLN